MKILGKLSRQVLLNLALLWLDDRYITSFPPYLQPEEGLGAEDDEALPYPAAETVEEVRHAYEDLQERKGGKREVLERILEGDWRHGITLRQLAMADLKYMDDHPASLRWTALELSRIDSRGKLASPSQSTPDDWSSNIPRTHAATFVKALQHEIAPLVKAHYHLSRSSKLPLTFLRILVVDSPYQNPRQSPETFTDSSRIMYVAFPDSCPYVYTSITSTGSKAAAPTTSSIATDPRSLQRLVRDAIPKALSRPQERYTLKPTSLAAKNLPTLLALRGPGRLTSANGAFSIFADTALEGSPLDPRPANTVPAEEHMRGGHKPVALENKENGHGPEPPQEAAPVDPAHKRKSGGSVPVLLSPTSKKRRLAVDARFGSAGSSLTPAPLDRLDVRLLDPPAPTDEEDIEAGTSSGPSPAVSLTFTGSDVIGGIRKLAELGIVDAERIPAWMTGEEGVSMAVVRGGKRLRRDI